VFVLIFVITLFSFCMFYMQDYLYLFLLLALSLGTQLQLLIHVNDLRSFFFSLNQSNNQKSAELVMQV